MEKINYRVLSGTLILTVLLSCFGCSQNSFSGYPWKQKLNEDLPLFGHRNWIVVVDSAYPKQSKAGIETVATNQAHLEVIETVMKAVEKELHVNANIYLDAELDFVSDSSAPGIELYKKQLEETLEGKNIKKLPHEDIIYKLDEAAQTFNVLILKTNFVLPYTSVFFELDCGYWNAEKEKELRESMPSEK